MQPPEARSGPGPEPPRPRLTFRRLVGLDRSGPSPPETLSGAPLRPWTIPNFIGYFRLGLIPVFLVVALTDDDGKGLWPALLYAVIGWGDYADGIAARVTGQFSRMGALLDPVVDRMLVVSGVVVAWDHTLLPRWALVVLAVREVSMLALGRLALYRGVELKINWPGRLAVAPVMGSFFFAMAGVHWLGVACLYVGLALALTASALYLRYGLQAGSRPSSRA